MSWQRLLGWFFCVLFFKNVTCTEGIGLAARGECWRLGSSCCQPPEWPSRSGNGWTLTPDFFSSPLKDFGTDWNDWNRPVLSPLTLSQPSSAASLWVSLALLHNRTFGCLFWDLLFGFFNFNFLSLFKQDLESWTNLFAVETCCLICLGTVFHTCLCLGNKLLGVSVLCCNSSCCVEFWSFLRHNWCSSHPGNSPKLTLPLAGFWMWGLGDFFSFISASPPPHFPPWCECPPQVSPWEGLKSKPLRVRCK